jgi:hypothetical protein
MRRYDIAGILPILSIIYFALAVPVPVQEKHQARVDVVNIPKDVTTVLGKRWEEELEKLGEEYFETSGKPVETSGTHSSSSTVPSVPDSGSTGIMQPPAPDLASSTTNPDPSMEPCCSPSSRSVQGLSARGNVWGKCQKCLGLMDAMADATFDLPSWMYYSPKPPEYSPYSKFPATKPWIDPAADPNFNWEHWINAEDPPPPPPKPWINPAADPDFNWEHWINAEDPPPPLSPPRPARPKVPNGQTSGHGPGPPPTGPEPSWPVPPPTEFYSITVGHSPLPVTGWPTETEPEREVVAEPPTSPDSKLHLDHQSLSAGSPQPEDLQAAIYGAKGKAKESRDISGTARDVGNAAQRELESTERPLDRRG